MELERGSRPKVNKGYDWLAKISRWGAYFAELAEPEGEDTQASCKHGCCRRRTSQRKPGTSRGNTKFRMRAVIEKLRCSFCPGDKIKKSTLSQILQRLCHQSSKHSNQIGKPHHRLRKKKLELLISIGSSIKYKMYYTLKKLFFNQ